MIWFLSIRYVSGMGCFEGEMCPGSENKLLRILLYYSLKNGGVNHLDDHYYVFYGKHA